MLTQRDEFRWTIPMSFRNGMKIEGLIFADGELIKQISKDQTLEQVANVATLPGLVGASLAMPDAHQGYGFCIGGVAAADVDDGVVSAGGVGFDINCGVRLLASSLHYSDITDRLGDVLNQLFRDIPCGTGKKGTLKSDKRQLEAVLEGGAEWAVQEGFGTDADLQRIEEFGRMRGADGAMVSARAKVRGMDQIGTLGSGNHFLEIQVVEEIFDSNVAARFGIEKDTVAVLIHSGSRGLGHQVCTDHLDTMQEAMKRYGISVIDRQLACVPIGSKEGSAYLAAMAAAANFAFANRQLITHWVREGFRRILGAGALRIVYDVCHNIAKREKYRVDGSLKTVLVHRKGATRAFPPGHDALPAELKDVGQPVLIPGSMGTSSFVMVGTEKAMAESFGSCCHGAGRAMSRTQAKRETNPEQLMTLMKSRNILVRCESRSGLTEEKPDAYKDIESVINVVSGAGIGRKVAKLRPVAVMKG